MLNWETLVKKAWRFPNRFPGRSKWKVGRRLFLSLRWQKKTKTKTKTAGSKGKGAEMYKTNRTGKHSGQITALYDTQLERNFAKNDIRKDKRNCEAVEVWKPWSDFHAKKGTEKGWKKFPSRPHPIVSFLTFSSSSPFASQSRSMEICIMILLSFFPLRLIHHASHTIPKLPKKMAPNIRPDPPKKMLWRAFFGPQVWVSCHEFSRMDFRKRRAPGDY